MLKTYWEELLTLPDPLLSIRQKSWERFEEIGLPKAKEEAFQYVKKQAHFPSPAKKKTIDEIRIAPLLFVDGFFEEAKIEAPLVCLPFNQALRSYALFLQTRLSRSLKEEKDPFALLNGAFQGMGAFLYVPPNCKAVLHLEQMFSAEEMASPRLHIFLGRNAELKLTQTSQGKSGFANTFLDFVLDQGSKLTFCDHAEGDFQSIRAVLKRDSELKTISLGKKVRTSIKVELTEENASASLFGLCRLEQMEESHFYVGVEHKAPHTRSRQHFKSVLQDKAKFSFEGKIHVSSVAQKTESYQLSNNLVLSDEASANAKPNLEIFADDVKASHGATIGQLNEEELFYLRSRGLSLSQAREWLIEGFCKEILDHAR
jgi:Fe-S cluster assembly protein SufD